MKTAIVGLGRVGSRSLEKLAPLLSGRDELALIDRDVLEQGNLPGCALYGASAVGKFKAAEAANEIRGSTVAKVSVFAEHLGKTNADKLLACAGLVLDCSDNLQTRLAINEYCWPRGIPWVYAGALQWHAMASAIAPGKTPCFACWATPGPTLGCGEAGVEDAACEAAAEKQVEQARELIAGRLPRLAGKLFYFNSKAGLRKEFELRKNPDCGFCVMGKSRLEETDAIQLCGSGEWMFFNNSRNLGVEKVFSRLEGVARERMGEVVRARLDAGATATVFPNGRVVVKAREKQAAIRANELVLQKIS